MLTAHPDDELLFGANDLLTNKTIVVCFTNANNPIRRGEFEECMRLTDSKGYMLPLNDSLKDSWSQFSDEALGEMALGLLESTDFDMIVSHGEDGEYGHIQHKRVHKVAKALSRKLSIPFATFRKRFSSKTITKRNEILNVYKSQAHAIRSFKDFFNRAAS